MQKIGITERGDAGLDLSWADILKTNDYAGAILITKNANPAFQNNVWELWNQSFKNIIIHFTCTGWGNTEMEPFVPTPESQLRNLEEMVSKGFPIQQCVLRIDPIIPTKEGIERFHQVMRHPFVQAHPELRIRISIIDKYPHIRPALNRILHTNYTANSWYPSREELDMVIQACNQYPNYTFECCAEPILARAIPNCIELGCISPKEYEIFQLLPETTTPLGYPRAACRCLPSKTELLNQRKQCPHQCAYCYWKPGTSS